MKNLLSWLIAVTGVILSLAGLNYLSAATKPLIDHPEGVRAASLIAGLVCFGTATIFMVLAVWSSRKAPPSC